MTTVTDYQSALDEVYRTFMAVKDEVSNLYDRDIRRPDRVVGLAKSLGILPAAEKVIRITGSKGKGTTTRAVAAYLQKTFPDKKIALFVSPEEVDHNDRMRLNGVPMQREEFAACLARLKPSLDELERSLPSPEYISPFGIFLLIALIWFKDNGADLYVLEGGRGAMHDEVGHIPSKVSIITSVFLEHPDKLGPGIEDVAVEKFFVTSNSDAVVVSEQAEGVLRSVPALASSKITSVTATAGKGMLPAWLVDDLELARIGTALLVGGDPRILPEIDAGKVSAAFLMGSHREVDFAVEGIINLGSLDLRLIDDWMQQRKSIKVICSFPDDKDRERLIGFFRQKGLPIVEVILTGTRGYLHYDRAANDTSTEKIVCEYNDAVGFIRDIDLLMSASNVDFMYFAGTQTFVRLARAALLPELEING